ncbi:MAG TPA: hypothetical protein VN903_23590 [Polyangia bacterium]|nr:hypothetical protein [Polyangia bacterium]
MDVIDVVVVAASAIPLIVVGLDRAAARRRRRAARRELLRVAEVPIAAIKDGDIVRIKGRAAARESLRTSPVSRRPCIAYRLTVYYRDGINQAWRQVVEDDGFSSFTVADDSGQASVDPSFEIRLDPYRESSVPAASPMLASLLATGGVTASEVFGAKRQFRYVEIILRPGDKIIAVGRATIEIDRAWRAASHREPPVMCHLTGAEEPVVIATADEP